MRRTRLRLAAVVATAMLGAGCGLGAADPLERADPAPAPAESTAERPIVTVGTADPIAVEVAANAASRGQGLMGRDEVPPGTGMLFAYPELVTNDFWMGNVRVPLSIAWLRDGVVVGVAEMVPCPEADLSCPRYSPKVPFDAAVETTGGAFTDADVRVGDRATLDGRSTWLSTE